MSTANGIMTAYINGRQFSEEHFSLFTCGHQASGSQVSLFTDGVYATEKGMKLYMKGVERLNASPDMYLFGVGTNRASVNLHNRGGLFNGVSLFAHGGISSTKSLKLRTVGYTTYNTSADLYIPGGYGEDATDSVDLYTKSHKSLNSYITLFEHGGIPISEGTTLFVDGIGTNYRTIPLHIKGITYGANSYLKLHTYGGTEGTYGVYNSIGLHLEADVKFWSQLPLHLKAVDLATVGKSMNLFLKSGPIQYTSQIPLHLANAAIGKGCTLYVRAPGLHQGYLPYNASVPMFINRINDVAVIPLFCKAPTGIPNSYITLHANGVSTSSGNLQLVLPKIVGSKPNKFLRLRMRGHEEFGEDIELIIPIVNGVFTTSIPLYLCHLGGAPNSFIPLHVMGANFSTKGINLVLPEILGLPTTKVNLYTHGY